MRSLMLIILLIAPAAAATDISFVASVINSRQCDVSLSIRTEKDSYSLGEQIGFYTVLNQKVKGYTIEYWIEDGNGNIVKKIRNSTNTNRKSFTPKKLANGNLLIKAEIIELGCDDADSSDNYAEKAVFVAIPEQQNLTVKNNPRQEQLKTLNAAKGNTIKNQSNKVTTPEKKETPKNISAPDKNKISPEERSPAEPVYTSSTAKAKKLVLWLIIALTTTISIVLVWKR